MKKSLPDHVTFLCAGFADARSTPSPIGLFPDYSRTAKEGLIEIIQASGGGRELLEYCRHLSYDLVKNYMAEDDVSEMMERFQAALAKSLHCTPQQAHCLVSLTLELIHYKVHGDNLRSPVDLSYLIAMATAAIQGVGPQ